MHCKSIFSLSFFRSSEIEPFKDKPYLDDPKGRSLKYIPLNSLTLLKHHKLKNGEENSTKLWWENLPTKRKDKNKVIMEELDKIKDTGNYTVRNYSCLGVNLH